MTSRTSIESRSILRTCTSDSSSDTGLIPGPYAPFARRVLDAFAQLAAMTTEADVAETVWRAVNDVSGRLRFPAGPDALALAQSASAREAYGHAESNPEAWLRQIEHGTLLHGIGKLKIPDSVL